MRVYLPLLRPRNNDVKKRVLDLIRRHIQNLGFACRSTLRISNAIGLSRVVIVQIVAADSNPEVSCLIQPVTHGLIRCQ